MLYGNILGAKETLSSTFEKHPERRAPSGEMNNALKKMFGKSTHLE
jgi:hypothetical protein